MKRLELAVVGCGDIAGYVALVSKLIPQIRLTACCDVESDRAQAFARQHGIRQVFTDYADLLARGSFQAVYLAVPHDLHCQMILQAVEAGKPVLTEKPLARTLPEGIQLVETVRQRGVKVGVNYQYRYDSGCYALARAVQTGSLGRVHSLRINVPWRRTQAYFEAAPWHKTVARSGGGTLLTQGSHFLDVALWALGEPPVSAVGYTASPGFNVEVETLAHGIVQTRGGTLISITSTLAAAREQAVTLEAYGENGTAIYRDLPFPSVKFVGARIRPERKYNTAGQQAKTKQGKSIFGGHPALVFRALLSFLRLCWRVTCSFRRWLASSCSTTTPCTPNSRSITMSVPRSDRFESFSRPF